MTESEKKELQRLRRLFDAAEHGDTLVGVEVLETIRLRDDREELDWLRRWQRGEV